MGSSRLRAKSLMPIAGKPLLGRVVENIQNFEIIDEIIVATTTLPIDDPLAAAAEQMGVKVFRGSALNVIDRFNQAALLLEENDTIMRITADNPLINQNATEKLLKLHLKGNNDYTYIENLSHIVAEFFKVGALRDIVNNHHIDYFDKEHVTPYFRRHNTLFNVLSMPSNFEGLRHDLDKYLTVDTLAELEIMERLIVENEVDSGSVDFSRIYQWLEHNILNLTTEIVAGDIQHDPIINLAGSDVGGKYPTYIIAEIGQNHNGDVRTAQKLINMAVRCKADAVKFQKRDIPSELTDEAFNKIYDNPNSFGKTYGEHREFLEFNEEQHQFLKAYADSQGIAYICTPCDIPSVDLLERIGCAIYKVASRDLTNLPLLIRLAETGKPIILSTGMATMSEIEDALEVLYHIKEKLAILQCTSEYPCKIENVNLNAMMTLKEKYGITIGFSDHTSGVSVSVAASVMGAAIIEKHITLSRTMKGTDQAGSLEERGLFKLIDYIRASEKAMGSSEKEFISATTQAKIKLARSLTSKVHIPKGTVVTEEMLTLKSPGDGLAWKERDLIIGRFMIKDFPPNQTIRTSDVKE